MSQQSEIGLLILLFAPLLAAILSLTDKFFPAHYSRVPSFLIWAGGTLWGLVATTSYIFRNGSLVYSLGGWAEPYGIALELNGLTWIATCTDLIIAGAVWFHTRKSKSYTSSFYFFLFLALFSLQAVLYTRDLFNLFVWFEVLSLSSFLLIVHHRTGAAYRASVRYLFLGTVSIMFFLVGVWILYHIYGSLDLPSLSAARDAAAGESRAVALAGAFITAGILTRAAIFPFHTWLPEAHAAAPYPISALLSGFVIKAPMLALWRIYDYLPSIQISPLLIWSGAICALLGVIAAMVQKDAKKLLGYHSVSQMGYILAAFGAGGEAGKAAALFYIVAHALFKSLLFVTVGRVGEAEGSRNVYTLRGLGRKYPGYTALFAVAALSISGAPLFAGYTAKLLVSKALYSHPAYYLLAAAGVGTAASFFKLAGIFIGKSPVPGKGPSASPLGTGIPGKGGPPAPDICAFLATIVLAAGCILLGLLPSLFHGLFGALIAGGAGGSAGFGEMLFSPAALLDSFLSWYGTSSLLKAGLSIGGGFLLSRLLLSSPGKRVSARMRAQALGINGSLRLLTAGVVVVTLVSLLPYYTG